MISRLSMMSQLAAAAALLAASEPRDYSPSRVQEKRKPTQQYSTRQQKRAAERAARKTTRKNKKGRKT